MKPHSNKHILMKRFETEEKAEKRKKAFSTRDDTVKREGFGKGKRARLAMKSSRFA